MYDNTPIETRRPVVRREPPKLQPGDRVRLREGRRLAAAKGTVARVAGGSVVLEMDEPYLAGGLTQRTFYSYPFELELIPRVGRMGAEDLFADDEEA